MNGVNQRRLANVGNTNHHDKQSRFPANDFLQLELHQLQKLLHGTLAVRVNRNTILLARLEIMRPFMHDVRVGKVFLVERDDASFGGEMRLEIGVGGGEGNASVADFDDEVGEFEAVADGACGGGHVAGEPVDGSSAGVERHVSQSQT